MKAKQPTHCIVCNIRLNKLEQEIGLCYDCEQDGEDYDMYDSEGSSSGFYDDEY